MSVTNCLDIGATSAVEAIGKPRWRITNPATWPVRRSWGTNTPEVHPVDGLDLEHHMLGQDIGNSAR